MLSQVPNGKTVLRINLDETSICLFQGAGKGAVFVDTRRHREGGGLAAPAEPVQSVPQARRRCCLTHIAFVCDRHDLQPLLPQIIVGNENTFPAGAFAALQGSCPANVRLVRQRSAWNNAELCGQVVQWLVEALGSRLGELQPVLLLDACKLHYSRQVLAACAKHGVWPVLVPAKTTWLLQPLDTHAFLKYKAYLRERYQKARIAHGRADLTIEQFLPCVCDAARCVLECRKWAAAFEQNGFGGKQAFLGRCVKEQIGIGGRLEVPATRPTLEQLQACFPRRARVPEAALWRPLQPPAPRASTERGASSSTAPSAVGDAPPFMLGRTRSQHRAAVAARANSEAAGAAIARFAQGSRVVARGFPLPAAPFRRRVLPPSFQARSLLSLCARGMHGKSLRRSDSLVCHWRLTVKLLHGFSVVVKQTLLLTQ